MKATQDGVGYGAYGAARFVGPNVAAKKGAAAIVIRSIGSDKGRWPHTGGTNFAPGVTPIPAAALSVADAEQLERIFKRSEPVTMKLVLTPKSCRHARIGQRRRRSARHRSQGRASSWSAGISTAGISAPARSTTAPGVAITTAAAKRLLDGPRPRRTIRVVWFGAEEAGGFGGAGLCQGACRREVTRWPPNPISAPTASGGSTVNLPDSAKAVGDRLAVALAPLGIVRGATMARRRHRCRPDARARRRRRSTSTRTGLRYFDWHHTPEDTLDKIDPEQLRQNVAAWTAMLCDRRQCARGNRPGRARKVTSG